MRIIDLQKEFDEDMAKVRAKRGTPEVLAYAKDLRDIVDRASKDMDQTADSHQHIPRCYPGREDWDSG